MTMPTTNATQGIPRNRKSYGFSFPESEQRRRDSILRASWMRIVAPFTCRPSPRSPWDEAATGDVTPWKPVIEPVRNAIASALFIGNERQIQETVDAACAFCEELKADFRSMVPAKEEESIVALAMDETQVEGPANEAEMALVKSPDCPATADKAVQPLERQYERLGALIRKCRNAARQTSSPMAQRVAR